VADKPAFNGWEHAKQSFVFVGSNIAAAATACALWIALIIGSMLAATPVFAWLVETFPVFGDYLARLEDQSLVQLIFIAPSLLVMIAAWPSIAVAWHRFVLRREPPSILPFSPWRGAIYFALAAALLVVVWLLPGGIAGYLAAKLGGRATLLVIPALMGFIAMLALSMRVSLKLPAIAVADRQMTFARSWRETATMWPGMLWGTVVLTLPIYYLNRAIDAIGKRLGEDQLELTLLLGVFNLIAIFAGLLLYATFLSLTYQRVVGDTSTTFD